ncbi:MAG: hypothetical protein AMS18_07105 [Gemmatimonas sp. SG8_17]|nr:MAG: hypothetical protein AMS18_07105 [Gemmatimonas sp. SG8_17]
MGARRGVPQGSKRIPGEFRTKVGSRIRMVMKPYAKEKGEWAECCEAAESLKLHPHTVYNWYNGVTLPTIWNLVRFADLYEVSLDYLFGRIGVQSITELRALANEVRKAMVA